LQLQVVQQLALTLEKYSTPFIGKIIPKEAIGETKLRLPSRILGWHYVI